MRHFILLICSILLSVYAFAQNQNIKRIVLTDGTVINGQVEKQADGTIMVSTINGDVFFFQPSDINRIISVNQPTTVDSQSEIIDTAVKRKGNRLCFVNSGIALTKENYNSPKAWEEYKILVDKGRTGRIMLYSGLGSFVLGGAGIYIMCESGWDPGFVVASGVLAAAGLGVGFSGLGITISTNKKLDKLADSYYWNSGVQLSLGVQQHGVGFALNF